MARFKADEVDNYGGQGGSGFFYLKNDMDVANVRFMYNGIDDVEGLSVHQVEIDGKKRYVNCIRNYNEPVDACPFCRERMFVSAKLFIPIYDNDDGSIKIWERGKTFFAKISSLCSRYSNLVSHTFDIERHGKHGETSTTYEIFETGQDDTTLEDLPEMRPILGGLVLDKTADDMEYYLQEGSFPPEDKDEPVVRRRNENQTPRRNDTGRRTPVNARNNREDRF